MSIGTEKFRSISPAEFFYRNKEIAGFANPARAMYQSVRELVENALDATDGHGILPNVEISIEAHPEKASAYRITVKDNGIGIPAEYIPDAFGRVLFSSKYVLRQTRGLFWFRCENGCSLWSDNCWRTYRNYFSNYRVKEGVYV